MSKITMTPELLRELIHYDPESGDMSWRLRHPALYADLLPELTRSEAIERAQRFNEKCGGRIVGTDKSSRSQIRRVRISFGKGTAPIRKNTAIVAWAISTGREPRKGCEVVALDGDTRNLRATNLVECSPHIRCILENPLSGIVLRQDGRWTWMIRNSNQRLRGNGMGYDTQEEARATRDHKLAELGLFEHTRLSNLLNGQD